MISDERAGDFFRFMVKRETIRLRRERGDAWPWTDDPVLRDYKFTNVKREHDRTTRLLVEEFYQPNRGCMNGILLMNAATFRYFGTIEFARAVGWQTTDRWTSGAAPRAIKEIATERLRNGDRVFTGAYVVTNQGISAPKQEVVVDHFLLPLWEKAYAIGQAIWTTNSWRLASGAMSQLQGFGGTGFMTKEVLLDVILAGGFGDVGPGDRNTWCPAGPGARRGLNRLLGREVDAAMPEKAALPLMLDLFQRRDGWWPQDFVGLELHDIQFQLCEFDKYERTRLGEGKPRSRYRPQRSPK